MSDLTAIIIASIAAIPPTIVALLSLRKVGSVQRNVELIHISVNSRMDALIKATAAGSLAEGKEIGRKEEKNKAK